MKLAQSFEVNAPIDEVWNLLIDLERVAPCLPGAAITARDDEGTYRGTFQVKLGPTTASYRGQIELHDVDASARTATVKARGNDKRGQGGASATIVNTLVEVAGGTRVESVTDLTITGRLARYGRGGMIEDVSDRLMRDFAACLQGLAARAGATGSGAAPAAAAGEDAVARAAAAPLGMTPAEAAASAGAEARPEDSATEGKSPAELGLEPPAAEPGLEPREPTVARDATAPPAAAGDATAPVEPGDPAAPPAAAAFTPPPAAEPIRGGRLFLNVLWERIRRFFGRRRRSGR